MTKQAHYPGSKRAYRGIVLACVGLVAGMVGMAYAAVPLYQIFCQVTGYGGTTQRSDVLADIPVLKREINIRFDANVANGLKWSFKPVERQVTIKLGEQKQISYIAQNLTDETITGTATFNVTPQYAGVFFNKIECFCFSLTTLKPGEEIDMPVIFYVDPEMDKEGIMNNLKTITLSYTMFRDENPETPVAVVKDRDNNKALN
ncbi:MAG: cytochrome c oxidase assembly protein [Gammaproteobacteria bacterium]|nr:cytochrome c oxidase assembly protein [Gammaproteobacteria bacterium]